MDKNKSAPKLKDIPHIYWINLDDKEDRRVRTEQMFSYWQVANTRISAYDGRDDDLSGIVKGLYPTNITPGEIGCTTSHLKALKHFLENSDSKYAIIMEDDCSLDLVHYWNFTWNDFISNESIEDYLAGNDLIENIVENNINFDNLISKN